VLLKSVPCATFKVCLVQIRIPTTLHFPKTGLPFALPKYLHCNLRSNKLPDSTVGIATTGLFVLLVHHGVDTLIKLVENKKSEIMV